MPKTDTQFKKGNAGRKKGAINVKTKVNNALIGMGMNGISDIKLYMDTVGFNRIINDMDKLKPRDRVTAMLALLEYVEPKLARREIVVDKPQQIINIFGKSNIDENDNTIDIMDNSQLIE